MALMSSKDVGAVEGLSSDEVEEVRQKFGPNEVSTTQACSSMQMYNQKHMQTVHHHLHCCFFGQILMNCAGQN